MTSKLAQIIQVIFVATALVGWAHAVEAGTAVTKDGSCYTAGGVLIHGGPCTTNDGIIVRIEQTSSGAKLPSKKETHTTKLPTSDQAAGKNLPISVAPLKCGYHPETKACGGTCPRREQKCVRVSERSCTCR